MVLPMLDTINDTDKAAANVTDNVANNATVNAGQ